MHVSLDHAPVPVRAADRPGCPAEPRSVLHGRQVLLQPARTAHLRAQTPALERDQGTTPTHHAYYNYNYHHYSFFKTWENIQLIRRISSNNHV